MPETCVAGNADVRVSCMVYLFSRPYQVFVDLGTSQFMSHNSWTFEVYDDIRPDTIDQPVDLVFVAQSRMA